MPQSKVVFRYKDGYIVKGFTVDFSPKKAIFHVTPLEPPNANLMEVQLADLKAVFFVKSFTGHPENKKSNGFDGSEPIAGRRIKVTFKDGETMVGTTHGYHPYRPGFFVVPADPESNNERCFVVLSATKDVEFV
jgi:Family of unknown function (DUF6982)